MAVETINGGSGPVGPFTEKPVDQANGGGGPAIPEPMQARRG